MTSREQFEAWVLERAKDSPAGAYPELLLRYDEEPKDYRRMWVDSAWTGWKASRETLEIDLPGTIDFDGHSEGPLLIKEEVVRVIEAAGLKVAP